MIAKAARHLFAREALEIAARRQRSDAERTRRPRRGVGQFVQKDAPLAPWRFCLLAHQRETQFGAVRRAKMNENVVRRKRDDRVAASPAQNVDHVDQRGVA
jgi:hypothetical protein